MLRRHSAKSKSDLHRRKSTTSVRSVHLEHIDASVAQRDAQTAAMEAFSRAQDRRSATRALFPPQPVPANKENTSPAGLSRVGSTSSLRSGHGRPGIERRQSVRFVGPGSGLQTRASRISMRTAATEQPETPACRPIHRSQSTQSISYMPRSVLRNSGNLLPPDRTSSVGKTTMTPKAAKTGLSHAHLQALTPDYEKYTPEDDIASMPSSYRRVRKTRSMLTTRASMRRSVNENAVGDRGPSPHSTGIAAQCKQIAAGTLLPRYSFTKRRDSNVSPATPKLRAPKSMSFLKSRRNRSDRQSSIDSPSGDISPIVDAQETSSRSRILPRPPKLFGTKSEGPQREMAKTLRGSSEDFELPASGTGIGMGRSRSGSLRNRARKVSTSLRSRFKSLFINKTEEEAVLPAQQIEARRTHVSEVLDENPWVAFVPEHDHYRERSSLSRVSTRVPSLHAIPSQERLHSRRASIDSGTSAAGQASDERSRVTSWASTDTNTVIAHRPQESTEEWEKQRLSIINEHGIQHPSPSLGIPVIGLQTITSQEELVPPMTLQGPPARATVDSQRVYSALMKKMNETQQLAALVEQQRKSSDGSDPFRTLSPSSSIGSGDSSDTVASAQGQAPGRQLSVSSRDVGKYPSRERPASGRESSLNNEITQSSADDYRSPSPPIHLTPKGGGRVAARTITDRGSAFFGSPTSHLFRTTSPFRRTLGEAMRAERGQVLCEERSGLAVETKPLSSKPDPVAKVAYSESNYSSDTLIHQMDMRQGDHVVQHPNVLDSRGEASVFEDTPTYRPTGERHVSTASSIGWKTWLSADIAKLEPSPTRVSGQSPEVEYRVPTMPRSLGHGHVREAAQTGSCEEDEDNAKPPVRMPTSSATPLSAVDSNVVKLSPQQRSVMRTTTPPAAGLHNEEVPTPLEYDALTSFRGDDASNRFCKDAARSPALPSEKMRLTGDRKFTTQPETPVRGNALRQSRSLAGLKSIGQGRIRESQTGSPQPPASSTVRLMRKSASKMALNPATAASSPGFTGVFERQFGSVARHLDSQPAEKENQAPHHGGTQKQSPNTKGQFRGSKAMVDLFLSSRRRQEARGGDATAYV